MFAVTLKITVNNRLVLNMERKVGEIFTDKSGSMILCKEGHKCADCCYCNMSFTHLECLADKKLDDSSCLPDERKDRKDVIFKRITDSNSILLVRDFRTLERIAKEYPGKTLENVIMQLKSRFNEIEGL